MYIGFILFFVGIIEEFINILYYKLGQKNYKYFCGFVQMFRVYIWAFVITSIFKNLSNSVGIITLYALGGALGDYLSLTVEPFLEKKILFIHKLFKKKKGRRKKSWWLYQSGKTRK